MKNFGSFWLGGRLLIARDEVKLVFDDSDHRGRTLTQAEFNDMQSLWDETGESKAAENMFPAWDVSADAASVDWIAAVMREWNLDPAKIWQCFILAIPSNLVPFKSESHWERDYRRRSKKYGQR